MKKTINTRRDDKIYDNLRGRAGTRDREIIRRFKLN